MRIQDWFARTAEVRELRDQVVELTAELAALRALTRPTPVDWTLHAYYLAEADTWCQTDNPALAAHNDQALASWRQSFAEQGIDLDDEHALRTVVAGLIAAGGSSGGFACERTGSAVAAHAFHQHTILLQFRPKETS